MREAKQALEAERAAEAKKIPRDRTERLIECRRRLRQDWGKGQIVLAAEISTESLDTAHLQPMVETALRELKAAGVTATPETVLARRLFEERRDRRGRGARDPDLGGAGRRPAQGTTARSPRRSL